MFRQVFVLVRPDRMTTAAADAISDGPSANAIPMTSDTQFDEIDAQIEALQERLDTYRRGMILARAAIWIGGLTLCLVLTIVGTYRTPTIVFGAFTALLAGTIWFGATSSSRAEVERQLAEAESRKARLFDAVVARNGWVDMTPTMH